MKFYGILTFLSACLLTLSPQTLIAGDLEKDLRFADWNVSIGLVKPVGGGNLRRISFPDEPITLTTETVLVGSNTINEILKRNNILPDSESYGIIYLLNPNLKQLSPLNTTSLTMPRLKGGDALERLYNDGFRVLLTVDKDRKQKFDEEIQQLSDVLQRATRLGPSRFATSSINTTLVSDFAYLDAILKGINARIRQRVGRPLPTQVLNQLIAESKALREIILTIIDTNGTFGSTELDQIVSIKDDVNIIAKEFTEAAAGEAPKPYDSVPVIVRTFRNGQEVRGIRIYYSPPGLRKRVEMTLSFGVLSPVTNRTIPVSKYCFWAGNESDPTPTSNVQCESFTGRIATVEIQLTLNGK